MSVPIDPSTDLRSLQTQRLSDLRETLEDLSLDGLMVSHGPNIRYLSGFSGSSALLFVARADRSVLLTDFRYEEQAAAELSSEIAVRIARRGLVDLLSELFADATRPRSIGFEAATLTVRDRREFGERCGSVIWEEAPQVVERMRELKAPEEVALLSDAARVAERALELTLGEGVVGMTERRIAGLLEYHLKQEGSERLPFDTIVASGSRSSLPHAEPTTRQVAAGDLLLIDFGASVGGYGCDITRTRVMGASTERQRELHEAVLEAQSAAIGRIAAGVAARDVDRAAREALEARGLAEQFGHSTGHGIGLEVHEAPRLATRSEDTLEAGHVVTVEPGVYLSGYGGVRIEDDVLVTRDGAQRLTNLPRELEQG